MNRRQFLSTTAAGLALSAARGWAVPYADQKRRRVGLIGTGWYGKCDLLRLIQIAPIEKMMESVRPRIEMKVESVFDCSS